jgi:syntaxin 1B/2/3
MSLGLDRLGDLMGGTSDGELDDFRSTDVETSSPEVEKHIKLYEPIKDQLAQIDEAVEQIGQLQTKDRVAAKDSERHEILAELEDVMSRTTNCGRKVKAALDDIKRKNDVYAKENKNQTAQVQIRANMYNLHTRLFHQTMSKYQNSSEKFKQSLRDRVKRELSIVDSNLSEDQIEKIVDEGKAMDIVKQALHHDNLDEAIREIEQRHNDIQRLEKSVLEVFELFRDLATLVDLQQEAFDNIEHNISDAAEYVAKTEVILKDAEKYQKKARNRRCYFIIAMVIILVIVLAPILNKALSNNA